MTELQKQILPAADRAAMARHWLVRLASGEIAEDELQACRDWLADAENASAFRHERMLWQGLDAMRPAFYAPDDRPAETVVTLRPIRRHWQVAGWVAAAAAACLTLAVLAQDWLAVTVYADHATATGHIRPVTLPDGSVAVLNTESAIAVNFDERERRIEILRGEVYVEVRKETARPFRVYAGDAVAQAMGTAFGARRDGAGLAVTVTEGTVAIGPASGDAAAPILLRAGERGAVAADRAPVHHGQIDAEAATSWHRGTVFLEAMPLKDAVSELDRYWPGYVVVVGHPVTRPVSLAFTPDGARDALSGLAASNGLRLRWIGSHIAILSD